MQNCTSIRTTINHWCPWGGATGCSLNVLEVQTKRGRLRELHRVVKVRPVQKRFAVIDGIRRGNNDMRDYIARSIASTSSVTITKTTKSRSFLKNNVKRLQVNFL